MARPPLPTQTPTGFRWRTVLPVADAHAYARKGRGPAACGLGRLPVGSERFDYPNRRRCLGCLMALEMVTETEARGMNGDR